VSGQMKSCSRCGETITEALERAAPAICRAERERIEAARRDVNGVPFLDAARALCPDGAHWEGDGWERYVADASACLDAFFAALQEGGSGG
jgi:hypothetical protein